MIIFKTVIEMLHNSCPIAIPPPRQQPSWVKWQAIAALGEILERWVCPRATKDSPLRLIMHWVDDNINILITH